MGIGGIGIWQLLIILLIVVMLFGTKKLRNLGSDLGGALKGFKTAMKDEDAEAETETETETDKDDDQDSEKSEQADSDTTDPVAKKVDED